MDLNELKVDIFRGKLVRLAAADPQQGAEAYHRWLRDSEYSRLEDEGPSRLFSVQALKEVVEREWDYRNSRSFFFLIHTIEDDCAIGGIGLHEVDFVNGDAFVGIGLGEREYWGKGYGTDAMRVMLRYAFTELNLRRISLDVFEYNQRAIRSYEKVGFVYEGRRRKVLNREGRRWDVLYMGILREEWER